MDLLKVAESAYAKKNDFPGGARCRAFGFSANGKGYIGGGRAGSDSTIYDFWGYDPFTDNWTRKGNIQHLSMGWIGQMVSAYNIGGFGYVLGPTKWPPQRRELWKYNPKPMKKSEKVQLLIGFSILFGYPFLCVINMYYYFKV